MSAQTQTKNSGSSVLATIRASLIAKPLAKCVLALVYATLLLIWGGATPSRLYGPSEFHRLQAKAILKGHFYIGDSLSNIQQNLALYHGKIQHVWGLGVGLWLAPFESFYHLFGSTDFPDRIAMGIAFALLAYYVLSTSSNVSAEYGKYAPIGFCALMLFYPAVLTLTNSRHLIYEDTILYASTVSMALLVATIRFALSKRLRDFYLCALLAAFSGLVRPTHLVYGAVGVLACSILLWIEKPGRKHILLSIAIFLSGLIFLGYTNSIRFGSPFEFGHRLTATSGPMVYLTRFQNSFCSASIPAANRELFGALFLSGVSTNLPSEETLEGEMPYSDLTAKVIPGQAGAARLRDIYTTSFDWTYLLIMIVAIGIACISIIKNKKGQDLAHPLGTRITIVLFGWFLFSAIPLWFFYLYFPTLSSRYLLDFGPAFSAISLLVWLFAAAHAPKISTLILLLWIALESRAANGGAPRYQLLTRQEALRTSSSYYGSLSEFNGQYSMNAHPVSSNIPFNGEGWNELTGHAAPVVSVFVDHPSFVELDVSGRIRLESPTGDDSYRARMGGAELHLESVQAMGELVHVRFKVPYDCQQTVELLSLCFIDGESEDNLASERKLMSIRWR